jgi:hypothetical protein
LQQRYFTFADLCIKICLQKRAVAAIASAVLIFRPLSPVKHPKDKKSPIFKPYNKTIFSPKEF